MNASLNIWLEFRMLQLSAALSSFSIGAALFLKKGVAQRL